MENGIQQKSTKKALKGFKFIDEDISRVKKSLLGIDECFTNIEKLKKDIDAHESYRKSVDIFNNDVILELNNKVIEYSLSLQTNINSLLKYKDEIICFNKNLYDNGTIFKNNFPYDKYDVVLVSRSGISTNLLKERKYQYLQKIFDSKQSPYSVKLIHGQDTIEKITILSNICRDMSVEECKKALKLGTNLTISSFKEFKIMLEHDFKIESNYYNEYFKDINETAKLGALESMRLMGMGIFLSIFVIGIFEFFFGLCTFISELFVKIKFKKLKKKTNSKEALYKVLELLESIDNTKTKGLECAPKIDEYLIELQKYELKLKQLLKNNSLT